MSIAILAIIVSSIALSIAIHTAYRVQRSIRSRNIIGSNSIVVDTNVLIDGRMIVIFEKGMFGSASIIVPQFVLDELQLLADGRDSFKRERARKGLENVARLVERKQVKVVHHVASEPVDKTLIAFCLSNKSSLCTTDYALELLAQSHGIVTINPNNLADMLKSPIAVGETFHVQLIKHGEHPQQGIGYLADGTLVVVNGISKKDFQEPVLVRCEKSFQTKSGKMLFARRVN
jgi:uncharacterized protein YacL